MLLWKSSQFHTLMADWKSRTIFLLFYPYMSSIYVKAKQLYSAYAFALDQIVWGIIMFTPQCIMYVLHQKLHTPLRNAVYVLTHCCNSRCVKSRYDCTIEAYHRYIIRYFFPASSIARIAPTAIVSDSPTIAVTCMFFSSSLFVVS